MRGRGCDEGDKWTGGGEGGIDRGNKKLKNLRSNSIKIMVHWYVTNYPKS